MASPDSTVHGGLTLRILGAPEFTGAHAEEATGILGQPMRLALLVYLAAALPRGFRRRDELLALIWPEADAKHARNSLRQSLHVLRKHLPVGAVLIRGSEDVSLSTQLLCIDSARFEELLDHGREEEALVLYRGDLLHGCHLADSPEFEAWLDAERLRLRRRAVRGALVLAKRCELDDGPVRAATWARFAMERAPLDEDVLHEVVGLLQQLGDHSGAAQLHAAAVERFRSQLGIALRPYHELQSERSIGPAGRDELVLSRSAAPRGVRPIRPSVPIPKAQTPPRAVPTEARRQYLEARQYSAQRSPATIARAIEGFEGALRLAPDYAEAHAGLAFSLNQAVVYIGYSGIETWPRIRAHASRALRLDPSLGEAHAMLAAATLCHDYDWTLAEQLWRRAVELDPLSEMSCSGFALYVLAASGRTDEALVVLDRARDIMPHVLGISTYYAMSCVFGRRFERAREEAAAVLDAQPAYTQAYWVHGMALEGLGDMDGAVRTFETGVALTNGSSLMLSELGRACALAGDHSRAWQILTELDCRSERADPATYFVAELLTALGDTEGAIDKLYAAYRQRHSMMVFAGVRIGLDPLRGHRRFRDLLMRLGIRSQTGVQDRRERQRLA